VIRYRNGVLNGKGASLLDGYMEDLATDRIYRLMLAQRVRHASPWSSPTTAPAVRHDAALLAHCFDAELDAWWPRCHRARTPATNDTREAPGDERG
jgi:malate synthase